MVGNSGSPSSERKKKRKVEGSPVEQRRIKLKFEGMPEEKKGEGEVKVEGFEGLEEIRREGMEEEDLLAVRQVALGLRVRKKS